MKVLVIGGTGFIGSAEKAKQLAAEEIFPIIGDASEPTKWLTPSLISTLDVIIDAIGYGDVDLSSVGPSFLTLVSTLSQQSRPSHSPKLSFIYTSGTWVYGDDRKEIVSDTTPIAKSADLVAWRPAHEQTVINSTVLNGIVIRPALVYGRSGSLTSLLFKQAKKGEKIIWYGEPGGRFNVVHTDDLANLYVLAAEKAQLVKGQIFAGANDVTESVDDILRKLVDITGAAGFEFVEPTNVFERALTTTSLVRPYLARSLLGWRPVKAGLVDHLEIYYKAWEATSS
ncbi:NAD(P)-binding domain superfamily protein [Abortiporus biennis]